MNPRISRQKATSRPYQGGESIPAPIACLCYRTRHYVRISPLIALCHAAHGAAYHKGGFSHLEYQK